MENKKVFIGNLNFAVTETELRELFSDFGTIVSVKLTSKKGYAFIEMEKSEEAERAVENLENVIFMDREIHISMALRPRKAKAQTIKRYNIRGEGFADKKKSSSGKRSSKTGSDYKSNSEDRPEKSHSGDKTKSARPAKREWTREKPSFGRSSKTGSGYKSKEKNYGSEDRSEKSFSGERSKSAQPAKRKWIHEKPAHSGKSSHDGEKSSFGKSFKSRSDFKTKEKFSDSAERSKSPKKDKSERSSEKSVSTYKPRTSTAGARKRIIRKK